MKKVTIIIACLALALVTYIFWPSTSKVQAPATDEKVATVATEDYVRQNISTLSPEKEVLGGKFYVTSIDAHSGAGTVSYEDGHNAFTADFTYSIDESGSPHITTFTIRK